MSLGPSIPTAIAQALLPLSFTAWGLAAAGAAAMSVPIIIHLLTRWRRRPQPWAAMQFLLEAYRKHRRRLQLEQWLLLLVRCLILLMLGLALAGPMLTGCGSAGGSLLSAGRTVYLVIDDSLVSHVRVGQDEKRIDQLKASAIELVENLSPNDRVAVVAGARPARMITSSPSSDRTGVVEAIETIEPRYSRADLPTAIRIIEQNLRQQDAPTDAATVAVFSPFARSSLNPGQPPAADLVPQDLALSYVLAAPTPGAANIQIASAAPRRPLIVVDPQLPIATPLTVRLRRFGPTPGGQVSALRITVRGDADAEPVVVTREHTWAPGQSETVLTVNVVIGEPDPTRTADEMLKIEAQLATDAAADDLHEDDQRLAVAQLRRQLRIGVVDSESAEAAADDLSPRYWLTAALTPRRRGGAVIDPARLTDLSPGRIEPEVLRGLDAVMVLRPDLVSDTGWRRLAQFTRAGGLTWLFVPDTQSPGIWAGAIRQQFGLDWRLALQVDQLDADAEPWSLEAGAPAPGALNVLAADWQRLLTPIRVTRRVPMRGPGASQTWLATEDGLALLAAGDVERGTLLVLAAALSPQWSNLVTKPAFVALVNETLRGVLGQSQALADLSQTVAGDRPVLPPPWNRAAQILAPDGEPISVVTTDSGRSPAAPLEQPGLYTPKLEIDWPLPVNVDASAGDVRALTRDEITPWFEAIGDVRWIEPGNWATAMQREVAQTSLAWPLLWIVLALVVTETLLARWVSHASQRSDVPWLARATAMIRGGG